MYLRSLLILLGLALAGCPRSNGGSDLGPHLTAAIVATPDLVGFPTLLDASGTIDPLKRTLSYAWHLTAVPAGSRIGDAQLSSTSGVAVGFEPDLGGAYQIALTVTAPDGALDQSSATVTVPTVPIFYYEGLSSPARTQAAVGVMRSDGTGGHLISCPTVGAGTAPDAGPGIDATDGLRFAVLYGMRTWDPPAGMPMPSRQIYLEVIPNPGGTTATEFRLWSADENTDCSAAPPRRIDSEGLFNDHSHFWPRFSPDGSRVLYVDKPQDMMAYTNRLVTIGFDKRSEFILRSGMPHLVGAAPIWIDGGHIAWAEDVATTGPAHLVIFQSSDGNQAGDSSTAPGDRSVLVDCGTQLSAINQFELVGGALILAGATPGGPVQIYRMAPGACSLSQPLAPVPDGNMAADFSVSPDGKSLLFSSTGTNAVPDGGATPQRDLYLVPADGSSAPVKFAGDPTVDDFGPRWIGGGRQVLWTQAADSNPSRGGGLVIANADGTHLRSLYAESGAKGNTVRVAGGSNLGTSCELGASPPVSPPLVLMLVAAALFATGFRRRR